MLNLIVIASFVFYCGSFFYLSWSTPPQNTVGLSEQTRQKIEISAVDLIYSTWKWCSESLHCLPDEFERESNMVIKSLAIWLEKNTHHKAECVWWQEPTLCKGCSELKKEE